MGSKNEYMNKSGIALRDSDGVDVYNAEWHGVMWVWGYSTMPMNSERPGDGQ